MRLRYKIISYAVAWLVALLATNPNDGLWALAWMFPLGLAAFIDPHLGQQWRLGSVCRLHRNLSCSCLLLFPLTKRASDARPLRHPCNSAHLQRLGMQGHAQYALETRKYWSG